ncbi:alkylhydroperoxidase/carboxymuconolactone decarboxylase family protein YurZ [Litoreibacter halocynthiae]|uniref:Alkylhydroperoxidase/carboxymuconolactone decarboxylase family protein YurZ n=1 Tax=Litoreibacter halocynthiae TaxID=1242689 RepID=A0A4R7LPB3_9RHOB|nr:carboxymuconolactone decarboxylase family protein [Litoreibacter halocynthiae]TDT77957.1 alkylhydroperoxidase/carboxymuconolactone decarboxylase family protein YurZ [Litoreibacter halocynthiae]
MNKELPGAAGDLAKNYPSIWAAYAELGAATANAGGLTERERRLIKLALAIGAVSEGAVHSHARRGVAEGIAKEDLHQVALLAIGPLGLPRAVAAGTWISDVTDKD